jgi:hypothetical protein
MRAAVAAAAAAAQWREEDVFKDVISRLKGDAGYIRDIGREGEKD